MTILVTGGAGYIGSHTCKELAKEGFKPVVFDNLSQGHEEFVKWGPLEKGNLLDSKCIEEAIVKHNPQAIVHFAASAYVVESVEDPLKYYENNVLATFNLLKACLKQGVKKVIFSSTCAIFGTPKRIPIKEEDLKAPINPYGKTKWIIEQMLQDFDHAYAMKSISLRYFNASGSDLEGEIGERHEPETHLIPLTIATALGKREKLTVYGDDFPTADGSAVRDYIHVSDLAYAHLLALKKLLKEEKSDAFHLGCGRGISVFEIIKAVEEATGKKLPLAIAARRKGEPAILIASTEKTKRELGFKAKHSSIKSIVESAYRWQANELQTLRL